MVDKPTNLLRSCPEEQSQPDTQRGLTAPVSLYLLEHTSSWASGASCSQDSDGEDGLLKLQENSAWVAPDSRERAELQKHHQWCGHHQVSGFSISTQQCRRAAESRSTIHTGWWKKAITVEMTPKCCPVWTVERSGGESISPCACIEETEISQQPCQV